jgi:hypothetical protein
MDEFDHMLPSPVSTFLSKTPSPRTALEVLVREKEPTRLALGGNLVLGGNGRPRMSFDIS